MLLSFLPEREGDIPRLDSARIRFAVEQEMALRLPDVMFVSTYWGYERRWTADTLAAYAMELGKRLDWDAGRVRQEVELTLQIQTPVGHG